MLLFAHGEMVNMMGKELICSCFVKSKRTLTVFALGHLLANDVMKGPGMAFTHIKAEAKERQREIIKDRYSVC